MIFLCIFLSHREWIRLRKKLIQPAELPVNIKININNIAYNIKNGKFIPQAHTRTEDIINMFR